MFGDIARATFRFRYVRSSRGLRHRPVRGVTLVEMLVVIAIIGTLVGLLLPGLQAAREAARRGSCVNNFKQWGQAMNAYHNAMGRLPGVQSRGAPGTELTNAVHDFNGNPILTSAAGWVVRMWPFIEQQSLFDKWDFTKQATDGKQNTLAESVASTNSGKNFYQSSMPVSLYWCPSDRPGEWIPGILNMPWGCAYKCNYHVNVGKDSLWPGTGGDQYAPVAQINNRLNPRLQGPFGYTNFLNSGGWGYLWYDFVPLRVTFDHIIDGLSTTILMGEVVFSGDAVNYDSRGSVFDFATPGVVSTMSTPNNGTDYAYVCNSSPNTPCNSLGWKQYYRTVQSVRSRHYGGANVVMCDGSVQFISDSIDLNTWQALGTKNGVGAVDVGVLNF